MIKNKKRDPPSTTYAVNGGAKWAKGIWEKTGNMNMTFRHFPWPDLFSLLLTHTIVGSELFNYYAMERLQTPALTQLGLPSSALASCMNLGVPSPDRPTKHPCSTYNPSPGRSSVFAALSSCEFGTHP